MCNGTVKRSVVLTPTATARGRLQRAIRQYSLLLAVVAIFIIMGALNPRFLSTANLRNIMLQCSINMVIASGMTFCIVSGGLDLSVGSVGVMSGCVAAKVMIITRSPILGVLAGLAAGLSAGLVNGFAIAKMKVPPFITTMGMQSIGRGLALVVTGGLVISGLPRAFTVIGTGYLGPVPIPVIIALCVVAFSHFLLSRTEFGLNVVATGGNYEAARLSGVNTERVLLTVYTYQGVLAAMGGLILTARVLSAQPALMQTANLDAIAAAVVGGTRLGGGKGTITGTILGAILIGSLFNGLNIVGVGFDLQLVIIGAIIILAIYYDVISRRR